MGNKIIRGSILVINRLWPYFRVYLCYNGSSCTHCRCQFRNRMRIINLKYWVWENKTKWIGVVRSYNNKSRRVRDAKCDFPQTTIYICWELLCVNDKNIVLLTNQLGQEWAGRTMGNSVRVFPTYNGQKCAYAAD